MTPPQLIDAAGRLLRLDRQIGRGGEGAVFAVAADAAVVAKVYHTPPAAQTVEKLRAMLAVATPRLLRVTTWPTGLLFDARSGQPAGFTMPRLDNYQEIWRLYHPVERLKCFPRAGWRFQVRAAYNLAAAFDEVHKTGCVVGDVQLCNAHVSLKAGVRLIDCDSFQIRANGRQYLCDVGQPHYTPPELQGKPLRGLVRTENHDRFGLAVLVYQLLFVGRHPYQGVYTGPGDPSFEQLIAEFRFGQGPLASSWGMAPPPHTPTIADVPPDLATLFRRAFERGGETGTRPRAAEWLPALVRLEASLAECATDPGHTYWQGAPNCVWCRIAARGGPEYYFGVAEDSRGFAIDEARLQDVLRRLAHAGTVEFAYDRNRFRSAHPFDPEPLPGDVAQHRPTAMIVGTAAILCAVLIPLGLVRGYLCAVGLPGTLVFGTWLAILLAISPWRRERRRRRAARESAWKALRDLETLWDRRVASYLSEDARLSRSVRGLVTDCRALGTDYQAAMRTLARNAEAAALSRHLRLHLIADADIPLVGAARQQALASRNIVTAADVEWDAIRRIKGFGDALAASLVDWRRDVESRFRFNPATAVSPADQRALVARFRGRQQQLLAEMDRGLAALQTLPSACREDLRPLVPRIREAVVALDQAEADLQLLDGRS